MSRSLLQETIAAISALVGTVALSAACGSDDAPAEGSPDAGANGGTSGVGATGGSGGTSGTAASDAPLPLPSFDSLPPGWSTLKPGGETLCAHGSAFQFFVRPGTVNRVLIEFSGTGACWDENSCRPGSSLYRQNAAGDLFTLDETYAAGVRDHNNPRNPFKDWHHVYIPSCSGSGHWGDTTMTFGTGSDAFMVYFKGTANSRAALTWVFENITAPEKAFVTGCSGGSFGALVWSPHVRERYGAATTVYHFADSGVGIVTDEFAADSYPVWNTRGAYPTFIPHESLGDFEPLTNMYAMIGRHFPDMFLSLFTPHADAEQYLYYDLFGGGSITDWTAQMNTFVSTVQASTPSFRSFIAPGTYHCILPYPNFYEVESNGVKIVDWIAQVVADQPVSHVTCGNQCDAQATAGEE
jgi:hypothetical protein